MKTLPLSFAKKIRVHSDSLLFFIFVVDLTDEIDTNQQSQQKDIQNGSAVRAEHIQDGFGEENNANGHVGCADLLQVCGQVAFVNMFQMAAGIKCRLTKKGKNASGKEINAC